MEQLSIPCRLCTETFNCAQCARRHEKWEHGVVPGCNICETGSIPISLFKTDLCLKYHIKRSHMPLECVKCGAVFESLYAITENRFQCTSQLLLEPPSAIPLKPRSIDSYHELVQKRTLVDDVRVVIDNPQEKTRLNKDGEEGKNPRPFGTKPNPTAQQVPAWRTGRKKNNVNLAKIATQNLMKLNIIKEGGVRRLHDSECEPLAGYKPRRFRSAHPSNIFTSR